MTSATVVGLAWNFLGKEAMRLQHPLVSFLELVRKQPGFGHRLFVRYSLYLLLRKRLQLLGRLCS